MEHAGDEEPIPHPTTAITAPATTSPMAPDAWHVDTLTMDPYIFTRLISATKRPTEIGGLLIGERDASARAVRVLGFAFPKQARETSVFCSFDMYWAAMVKAAIISCDLHPRVTLVAWIHTHPHLSVFLSSTDVQTIGELQQLNPLMLAVVLDPYKGDMGAFHWKRHDRDTRIEYAPVAVDEPLYEGLQALKGSPQLKGLRKVEVFAQPPGAREE